MLPHLPSRRIMAIIRGTINNTSHKLNRRWYTFNNNLNVKTTMAVVECAAPAVLEPQQHFAAAHASCAKHLQPRQRIRI
ncbi:unnamed protein product [Rhizoctonia solani]|uniref:Uncharacterized protein n=1 Tax=Rhizoctonia solani TaxID=456999 RepID=A0A8H3CPE5_9AGAM|nr:unnamed protein product [Rhizoctonia solani]CAE6490459.1 unnamed protein product [Rhizoctonia solani]